jgi:hypothetical protein
MYRAEEAIDLPLQAIKRKVNALPLKSFKNLARRVYLQGLSTQPTIQNSLKAGSPLKCRAYVWACFFFAPATRHLRTNHDAQNV